MDLEYISHYRIIRLIGSGGMGEVYLAEDTRLKRQVAIKVLKIESTADAEKATRFEKEARAASALNHSNILTVFDVGKTDSFRYMVTEFVDGQTLREYFGHGSVPIKRAAEIMLGVARALDAAHQAGIIHRDVKPENIMIRRDSVVKVLDFGLAKLTSPKDATHSLVDTTPGLIMGTPKYMSPEQVRGLDVDKTTDIYSLGAVFYETIAGMPPFDEATLGDTIAAVLTRQPGPLDRQNPETPPGIQKIVECCLNKDREERYRTMTSLIFDLENAVSELQNENVTRMIRAAFTEQPTIQEQARDTGDDVTIRNPAEAAEATGTSLRGRIRRHPLAFGLVAAILVAVVGLWLANAMRAGAGFEVAVRLAPPGSRILVDDQPWGMMTEDGTLRLINLKSGKHIVKVVHPNFECMPMEVVGEAGVTLEPLTARCTLIEVKPGEDVDDLHASWERAEPGLNGAQVADTRAYSPEAKELNVSATFFDDRQRKAMEERPGEKGISPPGLDVPIELSGDGIVKQRTKLAQLSATGYQQPMDFAELAEKRLTGSLIELPMATRSFYLDVGGSVSGSPFASFSFPRGPDPILPGLSKYNTLKALADNLSGERYSLDDPSDRQQMRRRLLRMLMPRARAVLFELADAYHARYSRPLRVTALTRSLDYQIMLNATDSNSFSIKAEDRFPPHSSGLAFDLGRTHMPVDEQNFVMDQLAQMERKGKLDALILYGENAGFHVFVYDDGAPPQA